VVGFLGSNMIMFLWMRHPLAGLDCEPIRPRLWAKGARWQGVCLSRATTIVIQPRRKVLTRRKPVARCWWASASGTSRSGRAGIVSSAKPPTRSSHSLATATASHRRAARGLAVAAHPHDPAHAFGELKAVLNPRLPPTRHRWPRLANRSGSTMARCRLLPNRPAACTAVAAGGS
jgi:hypothetical protein